ncbi:MAG: flagellar basal-body rod protein FlgB [Myxococcota bacterium]|jgi:flagellar basal-body rod protein FlgB
MAIRFDKTTQMLQSSLNLRLNRQHLLSSNLANVDTPHYKPRDLQFEGFLKEASGIGIAGSASSPGAHASVQEGDYNAAGDEGDVMTRDRPMDTLDGNRVQLDETVGRITDNSMRYNAALELMRRKMALLNYASNGGQG